MDDRFPPQAIIIEQQLLCSIMENVRLADEAIDRISENEFHSTANKLVFGAIKKLRNDIIDEWGYNIHLDIKPIKTSIINIYNYIRKNQPNQNN